MATEWVKGKTVDEALAIKNMDIVKELSLPPVKIHCSVLAEDAIRAAIGDWKKKQEAAKPVAVEARSKLDAGSSPASGRVRLKSCASAVAVRRSGFSR